jgi:hypothetical protein
MFRTIVITFILLPSLGVCQDYQTVRSDFVHFFLDENGSDHGMRMDSVFVDGSDSILMNYLTLRYPNYDVIDAYVPSWLGAKTVIRPNGKNLFFNSGGDTIHIETLAQLNDGWNLFSLDPASYLEGTVTDISPSVILDSAIEVKTISLQRKDLLGNPLAHALNGKTIKISSSLGILQGFDFHLFPDDTIQIEIAGMENPDRGLYRLTWHQIYDFQVGDEFHYKHEDDNPGLERRIQIVTNVTNGFSERTVEFDVYKLDMWFNGNPSPQTQVLESSSYQITEEYGYLNERNLVMSNAAIAFDSSFYEFNGSDSIFGALFINSIQSHYSDRLASYSNYNNIVYALDTNGYYYAYQTVSGGTLTIKKYADGIGRTYWRRWESDGWLSSEAEEQLVYFKKGSTEWGTPYSMSLITGIEDSPIPNNQLVYPNPIKQGDLLNLGVKYDQVEVFDVSGKSILSGHNTNVIETESLSSGIYFVETESNSDSDIQKLIITD